MQDLRSQAVATSPIRRKKHAGHQVGEKQEKKINKQSNGPATITRIQWRTTSFMKILLQHDYRAKDLAWKIWFLLTVTCFFFKRFFVCVQVPDFLFNTFVNYENLSLTYALYL